MPDLKISQMTTYPGFLTGEEFLPMVKTGDTTNYKVLVSQLQSAFTTAGGLVLRLMEVFCNGYTEDYGAADPVSYRRYESTYCDPDIVGITPLNTLQMLVVHKFSTSTEKQFTARLYLPLSDLSGWYDTGIKIVMPHSTRLNQTGDSLTWQNKFLKSYIQASLTDQSNAGISLARSRDFITNVKTHWTRLMADAGATFANLTTYSFDMDATKFSLNKLYSLIDRHLVECLYRLEQINAGNIGSTTATVESYSAPYENSLVALVAANTTLVDAGNIAQFKYNTTIIIQLLRAEWYNVWHDANINMRLYPTYNSASYTAQTALIETWFDNWVTALT